MIAAVLFAAFAGGQVIAGPSAPSVKAPRVAACDPQHPGECRRAITYWRSEARDAQRSASWQKKARATDVRRVLDRVRGAQPFAYSARIAYAACVTFSDDPARCRPPGQMLSVGRCESGLKLVNPNPVSTADSWMQYLLSTWQSQPIAKLGWFSRYDPIAVAIAAEAMSRRGWSAWRASIHCHHLP